MTTNEKRALLKAGVVIPKIVYNDVTRVVLLPPCLLKFDIKSWPTMKSDYEIFNNTAVNSTVLTFLGRYIGLRLMSNSISGDELSFSPSHPIGSYWGSVLQPVWNKQNELLKCKTCRDTGWDGIGYALTCVDCGKTK